MAFPAGTYYVGDLCYVICNDSLVYSRIRSRVAQHLERQLYEER